MIDPKEYLKVGQMFHGHKCPAMPLGLRVGAEAMNRLGVDRAKDKELVAYLELGDSHCAHCFGDGIQMITGCTYGKGNLFQLGYGKFALTLVDRNTNRAIRVVPKGEAQLATKNTPFFKNYREKGVKASLVPDEVVEPLIEGVLNAPVDQLLTISEIFEKKVDWPYETFQSILCENCGEVTVEPYAKLYKGKKVCQTCRDKLEAQDK
ncbi:MAG: tRNA CCA-pyrophosphorylase [Deltaproteobacteria bacterium]|nr:tRNA CCA-pyrophosphorylase [Deltaproteobacteria bacterium]